MGFFSEPFCQATTQAGNNSGSVPVRYGSATLGTVHRLYRYRPVPGLSPQRHSVRRVCVYSHGTGYVCLVCWEERNVPGPWGASSRVCQPSMPRIYL